MLARELRLPGQPPQMYWIYRDITDRMQAERSLKEREEELRHAHGGPFRESVLSKPFTPAELLDRVAQALNAAFYPVCAESAFDAGGSGVISP